MPFLRVFGSGLMGALLLTGETAQLWGAERTTGFAVVELFTSEGCSSCPPADRVLAELEERAAKGEAIYCLGYHVDYWNNLGWTDKFSSAESSLRQKWYARVLKTSRLYTPQMVVNGGAEFVGSRKDQAERVVAGALEAHSECELKLDLSQGKSGQPVKVQYHVASLPTEAALVLAIVRRAATSQVTRGENSGRRLEHVAVVRSLTMVDLGGKSQGETTLEWPKGLTAKESEMIGFVQQTTSGRIVAATRTRFP